MSLENITTNISKIETLIKQINTSFKVDEKVLIEIRGLISETTQLLKNVDLSYNIRKVIIVKMQEIVRQFHEILTKCRDYEIRCVKRDLKIKFPNLSQDEINSIIDDAM